MKYSYLLIAIMGLASSSLFAQHNTINANDKIIAHLNKFRADYITGMRDKKPELITAYYSEDIRLMPEFQKTILGKSNTLLYHKALLERFDIQSYNRKEIEILDLGQQVLEIGKLTIKMSLKSSSKDYLLEGSYLNVWQVSEHGEPFLITEAWNYDHYYDGLDKLLRFEEVPALHIALQPNVIINNPLSFELAALNRLLDETVTQHNAEVWAQFYAEDGMLIPNHHPANHGKMAIDSYIKMHVKELPIFESLDIRNDRIDSLGNYVIEYASHIASWKNGTSSGVSFGKNIRIWRREPDHSLKLFRSMSMYD